jgi:PhnB protein
MHMASNPEQGPTGGVTPHLAITDNRAHAAIDFYRAAFGATLPMEPMLADDGTRIMHAHLIINGGSLMLNDDFPEYRGGPSPSEGPVVLHLQVEDADKWFDRAVAAGATVTMPLADQFWGDRYGQVTDPFGQSWSFGSPLAK